MSSYQKRRKQNWGYNAQKSKRRREFVLKPGLKGFLCTCNNREKDCVRESYNILNEYADNLYGEEIKAGKFEPVPASGSESDSAPKPDAVKTEEPCKSESEDDEIEKELTKELDSLKAERTKQPNMRRFQVIDSGANNCIFIQTTLPEPVELVHHIMKDLESTKKQKTRFLLRLLPIEVTCKAYLEDIRQAADALFDKYFTKEGKTFAVIYNRRNSSGVNRDDLIRDLAEMVITRNPDNKADLKHPQLAILVEVIRNMCCLSVIPDYFDLRKYNLLELCSPEGGIKVVNSNDEETGRQGEGDAVTETAEGGEETGEQKAASAEDSSSETAVVGKGDCKESTATAVNESTTTEVNESTTTEVNESTTTEVNESTTTEVNESTTTEVSEATDDK